MKKEDHPFAIHNVETGKLNALVKNIMKQTGETDPNEAIRKVNSGESILIDPICAWREQDGVIYLSITSDGTTGRQWIKRLKSKRFEVSDASKEVLRSEDFRPTSGVSYEIAVLKGQLFKNNNRTTKKIRREAKRRQLSTPNPEIACLIRENFSDQDLKEMGLWYILVMHESINIDDIPELLCVDRGFGGCQLHTGLGDLDEDEYDDKVYCYEDLEGERGDLEDEYKIHSNEDEDRDDQWLEDGGFAFVLSQKVIAEQQDANEAIRKTIKRINRKPTCTWREPKHNGVIYFSVTSDGTTGQQWIKRLEEGGFQVGENARKVLCSKSFKPTKRITYKVAVLKGQLFKDYDRTTRKIRKEAKRRQLSTPNPEIACLIREKFSNQDLEEMRLWYIVVMHEPIDDSDIILGLLSVDRDGDGDWLGTNYGRDSESHDTSGFAFVL